MARPCFEPDDKQRKQVITMAGIGVPHLMIAKIIGCSRMTLEKYFKHELELGEAQACSSIAGKLYEMAMAGNVPCIIFWMKTRAGWNEKMTHEYRTIEAVEIPKLSDDPNEAMREYMRLVGSTDAYTST